MFYNHLYPQTPYFWLPVISFSPHGLKFILYACAYSLLV